MANMGSKGVVRYEESFAADNIGGSAADGLAWLVTGDTNDTIFARAVAAGRGLHIRAITAATNDNMVDLASDTLLFYGQEGHCAAEVLLQLTYVINRAFFFGFNDDVSEDSGTLPAELSGTTFTANGATHVGIVYDTGATTDELYCHWSDGGTKTTTAAADLRMTGMAPTNSQWLWMRVELQDRGSGNGLRATFIAVDHNGKSIEKVFNTSVTRSTGLCYWLGVENRSASTVTVYVKQPIWEQGMA